MPLREITCARESDNGITSRRFYSEPAALQVWQNDEDVCAFELILRTKSGAPVRVRWLASQGFTESESYNSKVETSSAEPGKIKLLFEREAALIDIWLFCFIEAKLRHYQKNGLANAA